MEINKEKTLADIVKFNFKTSEIFESYGLDYCCNGNRTVAAACEEKNINVNDVLEDILKSIERKNGNERFDDIELDELINMIVNKHHSYVTKMLPVITNHSEKVFNAHGKNHNELEEVRNLWTEVSLELSNHMLKEEKMLFPYILNLVNVKNNLSDFQYPPFGTVVNPINMMEKEHTSAGNAFFKIRELTNNLEIPSDACNTFNVFYNELKEFENDLHIHIHLENNILFPKAVELEKNLLNNLNN